MAEPSLFANFPQFEPSDFSLNDPNLFAADDQVGITSDLDLDGFDLDFSVEDLLLPSSDDNEEGSNSKSNSNSNVTSDSSPDSGSNPGSPESGNSSAASGVIVNQEVKQEDEENLRLKRKLDDDDRVENTSPNPGPNCKPSSRSLKIRRSDEVSSPSPSSFSAGTDEDEKRKARLMRNRESAQLSRQRKKHYVEELEEKVKIMNSTIADLNGKISFFMAENARLHQQLNGNGGGNGGIGNGNGNPPPAVYPPTVPPPYHFPWIPYPGYGMRPNGPPVPYVPIPRLKPQQPASAPRAKKTESKKGDKTKKVASVSLLGLLFIMMVFGGVFNFGLEGSRDKVYGGVSGSNGRVLSVKGRGSSLNNTEEFRRSIGKMNQKEMEGSGAKHNSSESLPALLYVPRNGKHVEINGNLIIHSVLASERSMAQAKSREQGKESSGKEGTSLVIPGNVASALAVRKGPVDVGRHSERYRNSAERQRALASDSYDAYRDNMKSTLADGPLQQWFREGLAGPILSSGTCTEVFQFEVSPSTIVPATPVANTTDKLPTGKIKNRRILYGQSIPLNGSSLNETEHFGKATESSKTFNGNNSATSMVVSVMADPREAGDGDGDGMIRPKSLSRIFVVVLMDSVKYVTYSCMLPLKTHGPHLVN
ncbi:bZIP transcription factor 39-like [Asparagus officinalis]|uniref:bZIP transcription factor 39-like n=1 Tax=Asparagus officinalis TaxID=4686 RepID=UPI00098E57D4|nr:bZIP transcription factor 39-like [Asparagus officinalis]